MVIVEQGLLLHQAERREGLFPHPHMEIIGAQGVGKTTLMELLMGEFPGASHVPENWQPMAQQLGRLNSLKELIFREQANTVQIEEAGQLALGIEFFFLGQHLEQRGEIEMGLAGGPVIRDTSLFGDALYADIYRLFGIFTQRQYEQCLAEFRRVMEIVPKPDLILGLMVSPESLVRRWEERLVDRQFELLIPPDHLREMARLGNTTILSAANAGWPVLSINTDILDFSRNPVDQRSVIGMVRRAIGSRFELQAGS